ncbi:MAG: bifunctional phosphopantothenoylcysteine decarboxylase/phosphopantothenate--cysteine ligase CoaBC [Clostridium sp.]|nr:bifunctional phosphopantothenoylcysteine decarboxylase/phosphopantothenate--cysteine ligase CoaBC [Prevotella sp.]MCM1428224.1 bifunctional phosphopantothenoylcysteine decarboxylase/phosphopantothenate--cysteine ligase CoaBC [Clostridium sp.]MCM1475954.1 bifunctional phosphopantothenoylcysteine decarboxylase/phosphopantothenate--cysteine ligase CoaBC [Muribaculaceae bacterium]
MLESLKGKHIVLGISGGIAAYKSAYLLRLFIKAGAEVQVVITPNGKEFITPATLAALSGKPVVSEFFAANTGEWHSHVDLGMWADLMVVAPATASSIAKMANGVADNMLITTYLSAKEQVMVAPAMDLDMWAHPSTQRNVETLRRDGVIIIEPESGELASHLSGKGRMAEPETIAKAAADFFRRRQDLAGKRVLISAGPTYENIDPVRFIGNYSSGKMGFALAQECVSRGAETIVVAGPVSDSLFLPAEVKRINVRSAREMYEAMTHEFANSDIAILAAAVADYAPENIALSKIKRGGAETLDIHLVRNPDIAASLGAVKDEGGRKRFLVGFALETDNEIENARTKLTKKNLDLIVLNSLRTKGAGFGVDTNKITIISANHPNRDFPMKSKMEVATDIVDTIVESLNSSC